MSRIPLDKMMSTEIGREFDKYLIDTKAKVAYSESNNCFFIPKLEKGDYSFVLEVFDNFCIKCNSDELAVDEFRSFLSSRI